MAVVRLVAHAIVVDDRGVGRKVLGVQRVQRDDVAIERDGVTVLVDEVSMELLAGAEIDYVEELIGASFQIRNPNASSSCGCGNSFSV